MTDGDFPLLRISPDPGDLAVIFSDVHFGIEDRGAVDVLVSAVQELKPRFAIAAGDIFDCNALSKHRRDAAQVIASGSLAQEAEIGRQAMEAIRVHTQYAVAMEGNHEGRVTRFVDENPGLLGTIEWHTPYADSLVGWDCLPSWSAVKLGPLLVHHGHDLEGATGVTAARKVLAAYPGQNTHFGHCHVFDSALRNTSKNGRQETHGAWTSGHLSDPRKHANYAAATRHRWQQGFSVVEFWDAANDPDDYPKYDAAEQPVQLRFTVHQVRIFRDSNNKPFARVMGRTVRG